MRRMEEVLQQLFPTAIVLKQGLACDKAKAGDNPAAGVADWRGYGAGKRLHVSDGDRVAVAADFLHLSAQFGRIGLRKLGQLFEWSPQILLDEGRLFVSEQHPAL